MKTGCLIVLVGLALGCGSSDRKNLPEIFGVYVREYSVGVTNAESGVKIGTATYRDTITISTAESEIVVANHKWRTNDYDNAGWRNTLHSDDRPKVTFTAILDESNRRLISSDGSVLYYDQNHSTVYWKPNSAYHRVKH